MPLFPQSISPSDSQALGAQSAKSPSANSPEQTLTAPTAEPDTCPAPLTLTLDVQGMKCAGCVKAVENRLHRQSGVIAATVNLVTQMAAVECHPEVDPQALTQALTEAGFPAQLRWAPGMEAGATTDQMSPAERQHQETRQRLRQLAIAILLLVFSTIGHLKHFGLVIPGLSHIGFHALLATLALALPGRPILIDGWRGLRHNSPNMNTLVGLGTLTAYVTSLIALAFPSLGWDCFFDEPVMLVGFILLGRALEQQARSRAAAAYQALLELQPTIARLHPDPSIFRQGASTFPNFLQSPGIEIPADRVRVGEWLQVLPGDKVPVDGTVVIGQTTVNEAMLTGEAMPVLKQPGDTVTAGTLNQTGAIAIQATRTGKDTTLAHIIDLVETAQTRKAPIQKLADTIAGYFTYGVMTVALATFLFWLLLGAHWWGDALASSSFMTHTMSDGLPNHPPTPLLLSLKRAIAVLVIACPCALGLATPTAILVGTGMGAERGILIRGGDALEHIHQLTTVVFDKTGTLTQGHPQVTDYVSLDAHYAEADLLQRAATVEHGTQHPLATAICKRAQQLELPLLPAEQFETIAGMGVIAQVAGQRICLGTPTWIEQQGISISPSAHQEMTNLAETGKTVVLMSIDDHLAGLIALQDVLRPDAQEVIWQLQNRGLQIAILTGDHPTAANAIAQELGLTSEQVFAALSPQGKVEAIAQLQAQGNRVAMVGDGINDAPALAQADVGIALHTGTDVARETADVIVMGDRLAAVDTTLQLSHATVRKIRQNLFWAFAYNIVGIPAAAGLLLPIAGIALSPSLAGAMMAFSSVTVVVNSLLLRRANLGST